MNGIKLWRHEIVRYSMDSNANRMAILKSVVITNLRNYAFLQYFISNFDSLDYQVDKFY